MKKETDQREIKEFLTLLSNLHDTADEYEKSGLTPVDLIKSTDAGHEVEGFKAIEPDKYDFENMTWGEACNFIILYSDYYYESLKKFRVPLKSKSIH